MAALLLLLLLLLVILPLLLPLPLTHPGPCRSGGDDGKSPKGAQAGVCLTSHSAVVKRFFGLPIRCTSKERQLAP
jgi:hypothetical protein